MSLQILTICEILKFMGDVETFMEKKSIRKRGVFGTYGPIFIIFLGFNVILTKLMFPKVRLVRWPIYVRGKKKISWGKNLVTGVGCRLDAFGRDGCIEFGENVQINDYVHIGALESVKIGNDVLIASKVFISDHNHGIYGGPRDHSSPFEKPKDRFEDTAPVVIEDNVWLGEHVSVLPGVKIGFGSVVGAMSVVTRDIPAMSIAVGAPAKVIKRYDENSQKWDLLSDLGAI